MTHGFPSLADDEKPTAEEDVVHTDNREDPPDLVREQRFPCHVFRINAD